MNLGLTGGLKRAMQLRGNATGLIDGAQHFCWNELVLRISKLAGALRDLGVAADDRVALLALNSHRSFESYFATIWAGAIITPLNHRLSVNEIAAQLADAEPLVLIVGKEFAQFVPMLQAANPYTRHVIFSDPDVAPPGLLAYESLLSDADAMEDAGRADTDGACLFYTGGTTGAAKGVLLSHENIMANTINFIAHIGMDQQMVHLHCGPLFHVAAGVRLFSVTQMAGTHVILPRFMPLEVLQTIAALRVTLATFVPTMLRALLDQPELAQYDLSPLEYITYGAAAMPEAMLREAMEKLPAVRFVQSYGMTETSPIATMLGWPDHLAAGGNRLRSAGRAALLAEIRIADAQGRVVESGVAGEIIVRGPMVMRGYWRKPEATAQAIRDGWMHTGDIGYLDGDGYLYVVDRLKDVIISGGENIYSQEIENVISQHPAVQACAVFGRPDPKWGETVHAVVVPRADSTLMAEDVIRHCRGMIATFKCPKTVQIRSSAMPLSGANKVLKNQLRAELLAAEQAALS